MRFADSPDVSHIPNVDAVIVVDAGQLVVSLVERQRDRVRILGVWWMLRHVTRCNNNSNKKKVSCYTVTRLFSLLRLLTHVPDGQALRDVNSQVMRPRERSDKLKRARTKTPDNSFGTSDEDVLIPDGHAVGAARLKEKHLSSL